MFFYLVLIVSFLLENSLFGSVEGVIITYARNSGNTSSGTLLIASDHMRIYGASDKNGNSLTFDFGDKKVMSIKITYNRADKGILSVNGQVQDAPTGANDTDKISFIEPVSEVVIQNVATSQVRVSSIEFVLAA